MQDREGSWVDVPPDPNSLVVNTGLAFETLSNGRFRATRHRVLHSERERVSIPFFLEPSHDFVLSPHSLGLQDDPPTTPLVYEDFLTEALSRFPEYDRGE